MFDVVTTKLLSGQFLCGVSTPDEYEYLARDTDNEGNTNAEEVNRFLSRMGFKLSTTPTGSAYFMSWNSGSEEGVKSARQNFAEIKNNHRFLVEFFKLVLDVEGNDYAATPGHTIDLNKMSGIISQNESLISALRNVSSMVKGLSSDTDRGRLDRIAKKMRQDGYLIEANKEQDLYQFTGKIEYLHAVTQFLVTHDNISEEDEQFQQQVNKDD